MPPSSRPKPVVLAILDGFGIAPDSEGNAVTRAATPNLKNWVRMYPAMTLIASGNEVGLQWGEMGNSEVGHLNIGAGRVYYQTYPRITQEIKNGTFFENNALNTAIDHSKKNGTALHIIGIISPGNVHGSEEHVWALLQLAAQKKVKNVFIHAILDGRDVGHNTANVFIKRLEEKIKEIGVGTIATLCGRFYAMDRDNRWDRVEKAYRAIVEGKSEETTTNPLSCIEEHYTKEVFDEEFPPVVVMNGSEPVARIQNGDAIIFANFRPDRARQLTEALALPSFAKFERPPLSDIVMTTLTEYEKNVPVLVAFPPIVIKNCLAEIISNAGLKQFHVGETEKYAHVTFFLNGTLEEPFPGEERKLIPSPKVSSYAEVPEMSAAEVGKAVIEAIKSDKYDFIVCNFANADMVGHTGNFEATKKGIEVIDAALGKIANYVLAKEGVLIITADHGNAEDCLNLQTNQIDKEHSTNPVPFIVIGPHFEGQRGPGTDAPEGDLSLLQPVGMLADVAPTILSIMGLEQPPEMTGTPLV